MTSFKPSRQSHNQCRDLWHIFARHSLSIDGFSEDQFDKLHSIMNSPKKNDNSNSAPPPTFKEQLDKEAIESRIHHNENGGNSTIKAVVDKISHIIPAAAPILGGSNPNSKVENKEEPAGPPDRPENDVQIEGFVRDQHRSNVAENLSSRRA